MWTWVVKNIFCQIYAFCLELGLKRHENNFSRENENSIWAKRVPKHLKFKFRRKKNLELKATFNAASFASCLSRMPKKFQFNSYKNVKQAAATAHLRNSESAKNFFFNDCKLSIAALITYIRRIVNFKEFPKNSDSFSRNFFYSISSKLSFLGSLKLSQLLWALPLKILWIDEDGISSRLSN